MGHAVVTEDGGIAIVVVEGGGAEFDVTDDAVVTGASGSGQSLVSTHAPEVLRT